MPANHEPGGREGHLHPDTTVVMTAVRRVWPMLMRSDERKISRAISQRLIEGHSPDGLRHLLCENTEGVRIPGRLLLHRLEELGQPAPTSPGRKPWCGACDNRWIDHGLGLHRCPQCHPGASEPACPDCLDMITRHGPVPAWCGHCDPDERLTRGKPCPHCHPASASQTVVA